MAKIELNKTDLEIANKVAHYYMYPEKTSYDEKIVLNEAIAQNKLIHRKALELNKTLWRGSR